MTDSELHNIRVGDTVKFTRAAVRNFPGADGRRRFTVKRTLHTAGFSYWDCILDDGSTWANQWLERVEG